MATSQQPGASFPQRQYGASGLGRPSGGAGNVNAFASTPYNQPQNPQSAAPSQQQIQAQRLERERLERAEHQRREAEERDALDRLSEEQREEINEAVSLIATHNPSASLICISSSLSSTSTRTPT